MQFVSLKSLQELDYPFSFRSLADEKAIVIGNHLLQRFPDLKIGDTLTIEANGKKLPWRIVGIYSITGNISPPLLYVNYQYIN
jgi:hypothetical protein